MFQPFVVRTLPLARVLIALVAIGAALANGHKWC
jgi:hypothetical protein